MKIQSTDPRAKLIGNEVSTSEGEFVVKDWCSGPGSSELFVLENGTSLPDKHVAAWLNQIKNINVIAGGFSKELWVFQEVPSSQKLQPAEAFSLIKAKLGKIRKSDVTKAYNRMLESGSVL